MKPFGKKALCLLLVLLMAISALPTIAFADDAQGVEVQLSAQAQNTFLLPMQTLTVTPGTAAAYGFPNAAAVQPDQVTVLDVLVAAHTLLFGDDFTPETASNYLAGDGWMTLVFGMDGSYFGFAVNGHAPYYGEYNPEWGTHMSYTAKEAVVQKGDKVEFFFYQDIMSLDNYTWFEKDGQRGDAFTVTAGQEFSLHLSGYAIGYYGPNPWETLLERAMDICDAQVVTVDGQTGMFTDLPGKTTDTFDGTVSLTFDEPGTYILSAYMSEEEINEYYATPIFSPWCTITVEEKSDAQQAQEDVQALYNAFSGHGIQEPIPFPYGTGEGQYTNVYDYLKAEAVRLLPHRDVSEIQIEAGTLSGTAGAGTPLEQKTMDDQGNITPVYSGAPTKPALTNICFTIGGSTSQPISWLYFSVEPLPADAQKQVELEASAITWDAIKGKNTDPGAVLQPVGQLTGSTVGALPAAPCLFTDIQSGVSITWNLTPVSGPASALTLESANKTTVLRPNVGQDDGVFRLTATVQSLQDPTASIEVPFDLTVPAFSGIKVPFRISPADAELTVTDSYYNAPVDEAYLQSEEDGALRTYTLHGSATNASQTYAYTARKDGYITASGSVTVTDQDLPETVLSLVPSTEGDTRLSSLSVTSPAPDSASIKQPMEAFSPETYAYTMTVGAVDSITLAPTSMVEGATIQVTHSTSTENANAGTTVDTMVVSGRSTTCYLKTNDEGNADTVITVTVTAPESSTQTEKTRTYTLTVTRTNEEHSLKSLTFTASGSASDGKNNRAFPEEEVLSPALDQGGIAPEYTYYVNTFREWIQLTPTAVNPTDIERITVAGQEVASGSASKKIALESGNNPISVVVTKKDGSQETYPINVRRKQPVLLQDFTVEGGVRTSEISNWASTASFPSGANEVRLAFEIPEGNRLTIEGISGEYGSGEVVTIPVEGDKKLLTVSVSKDFAEGGATYTDNQVYVIGLYRAAADSPDAVSAYLPAPGQFANQETYLNPDKTLAGPDAGGMVTLGAFGGSIVYYFDEPLKNDPANPYGIDFIVYGNVFQNADGSSSASSAEPGAVMVSEDGHTWYELAGSLYYDAGTLHDLTVTYENPDPTFTSSVDIPWTASGGQSGSILTNSYNTQPYFPNPGLYDVFNEGPAKNETYTDKSVSFTGSALTASTVPAYGYADTHANAQPTTNRAVNPYLADHFKSTNGDGMDLSWAVDQNGNPVQIDQVKYVKIYNPNLREGAATGEISPEISGILRAQPASSAVGKTEGLTALSINDKEIALESGKTEYTFDAEGATSLRVSATGASADDNIYINNSPIASGEESPSLLAGKHIRIVVQNGEKEPAIYTITLTGAGSGASSAELQSLSVIPGDTEATPAEDGVYRVTVPNSVTGVRVRAVPLSDKATVTVNGEAVQKSADWTGETIFSLTAGQAMEIPVVVLSADETVQKSYTLEVYRETSSGGGGTTNQITVSFTLIGDTKHGSPETHQNTETWIPKKSYTVPVGSSVKYVTDMALINAGISYTVDPSGTYITSINGLSEFDNGPRSGWMYTLNGTHADINGYATQTLKSGDTIVWHYSDDYDKEEGMDEFHGTGSGSITTQTNTKIETDGDTVRLISSSKATNSAATITLAESDLNTATTQAAKDGITTLEIAPDINGNVTKTTINLPLKSISGLVSQTQAVLRVNTPTGTVQLPRAALTELAEESGSVLTIELLRQQGTISLSIRIGGKTLSELSGGVLYSISVPEGTTATAAQLKNTDGTQTTLAKSIWKDGILTMLLPGSAAIQYQSAANTFFDTQTHWAKDAVAFAASHGLMTGTGEEVFSPDLTMSRAMLATVLYRMEGSPQVEGKPFADVPTGSWYEQAVTWAAENGIVEGTGNGFDPDGAVTREQLTTILYRYAEWIGADLSASGSATPFPDEDEISSWAQEAMRWAADAGILTGREDHSADPKAPATRAEVAAVLQRFIAHLIQV